MNGDLGFELDGIFRRPMVLAVSGVPDGWAPRTVRYGARDITSPTDFAALPAARLELVFTNRVARPSARLVNDRGEDVASARVVALPVDPSRRTPPLVAVPPLPGSGAGTVVPLGAILPGDYFVAAVSFDDYALLARHPSRLDALAAIGTRMTFEAGDTRTLSLRVVRLPDQP